jgi:hypothetical protein
MGGEAVIALRRVSTSDSGKAPDVQLWRSAAMSNGVVRPVLAILLECEIG